MRWRPMGAFRVLVAAGALLGHASAARPTVPPFKVSLITRLHHPTALALRNGDDAIYVAEQNGIVRIVRDGAVSPEPALDIRERIRIRDYEQGFLGLVFSPDGRRLYVDYTNRHGNTRIEAYTMRGRTADVASRRQILAVHQPDISHNGGKLAFGPDGYLYIALGDGGGRDDQGAGGPPGAAGEAHALGGNAQSIQTLLGKILRIYPTPSSDQPYVAPPENPFADGSGRTEIWAYGLRNPWKFSFDSATGDLWIGDVGQESREEIDQISASTAGANFGWARLEGTMPVPGAPAAPADAVPPILEYAHSKTACAVIGGFVYRGTKFPELQGSYLFGDFCGRDIRALRRSAGGIDVTKVVDGVRQVTDISPGRGGDVYVLTRERGLLQLERA